mmetsp:Transcript_6785/g.20099  ORF Transcript_6785/g.20099 Transcript_6785/m.20099 type:complete len:268 (+) Transcript_6785:1999-2802(+)
MCAVVFGRGRRAAARVVVDEARDRPVRERGPVRAVAQRRRVAPHRRQLQARRVARQRQERDRGAQRPTQGAVRERLRAHEVNEAAPRVGRLGRRRRGDVAPAPRAGRHEHQRQHRRDEQERDAGRGEARPRRVALEAEGRRRRAAVGRHARPGPRLGRALLRVGPQVGAVDDRVQQRELQMHLAARARVPAEEAAGAVEAGPRHGLGQVAHAGVHGVVGEERPGAVRQRRAAQDGGRHRDLRHELVGRSRELRVGQAVGLARVVGEP